MVWEVRLNGGDRRFQIGLRAPRFAFARRFRISTQAPSFVFARRFPILLQAPRYHRGSHRVETTPRALPKHRPGALRRECRTITPLRRCLAMSS
jgi:hypothetical protein